MTSIEMKRKIVRSVIAGRADRERSIYEGAWFSATRAGLNCTSATDHAPDMPPQVARDYSFDGNLILATAISRANPKQVSTN